jgi:hypothetical protein
MARLLHLLRSDSHGLALPVIERHRRDPDCDLTVVVLDGPVPPLPEGVTARRLGSGDLDYPGLLALIFQADRVVIW